MYYTGKYIDTFEAAMQMLFIQKGYDKVPHLDAMGRRCFGFYNGTAGNDFYISAADTQSAISAIAGHMNLEGKLAAEYLDSKEAMQACDEEGIVYGPVAGEAAVWRLHNIYYNGRNRYFFIKKETDDFYVITDPDGFPLIYYTGTELEKFFISENAFVITLDENDGVHGKLGDSRRVWEEGWEFYWKTVRTMDRSTQRVESFDSYKDISSVRIALWFGVANYIQNTEKVWNLCRELAGGACSDCKFRILQSNMLHAAESGQITLLQELETAIWKEIADEISVFES